LYLLLALSRDIRRGLHFSSLSTPVDFVDTLAGKGQFYYTLLLSTVGEGDGKVVGKTVGFTGTNPICDGGGGLSGDFKFTPTQI
jgi:hypothetical protein